MECWSIEPGPETAISNRKQKCSKWLARFVITKSDQQVKLSSC